MKYRTYLLWFVTGWGWGDPHITTLDDQTYTFNGIGEYVVLRSGDLEIQARTETASSNTTATVYSAIAATIDPNKTEVIQVNLDVICNKHYVYIFM